MKIFLNKNTHVGTDEPADKTKTWLPQNLTEEANFLSNPATYGVLSGPRVKIAEGLDAQNIDAYGEKLRAYEVEPSTLVIKEYKNGAWVNMELNLDVPEEDENSIVGTWYFNDSINLDSFPNFVVEFTNNGIDYVSMSVYDNDGATSPRHKYFYYHTADTATQVYYSGSDTWYDETYRTIVITSKSTDEAFITWLKANATKQGSAKLISFTIEGTSYQAEKGMTWSEWVESDYNNGIDKYRISGNYIYRAPGMTMYYISIDGTASGRVLKTNEITDGYVYSTYKQEINNN